MADGGVPAGWYPDPQGSGNLRYWDGAQWTEHLQPVPQPQQPATPTPQPAQPVQPAQPAQQPAQPAQPAQQPAQQPMQPGAVTPPPPPAHGGALQLKPPVILAGFGGLVMIISTLLPWASDEFDSVNGFEKNLPWPILGASSGSEGTIGSGVFVLLLGIVAVGLSYLLLQKNDQVAVPLIAIGAVIVLYTVWTAVKFNDEFGDFGVDIGFGLWLCLVGAALVVAGGVSAFVQKS